MANMAKIRLNVQLFVELGEAVNEVCETLNTAGQPLLRPVELAAAVEELALQRLPPVSSTR
jgi:ribosomal protein S10